MRHPVRSATERRTLTVVLALTFTWACAQNGEPVEVTIPRGATLREVADSLSRYEVIRWSRGFRWYVTWRGLDDEIKAGTYRLRRGMGWGRTLGMLRRGEVVTIPVTIPEGWTAREIADRLAPALGISADSIRRVLLDTASARVFGVAGPTLEGFLYPETYRLAPGSPLEEAIAAMVARYRDAWTPERRVRAESLGLSEREAVTLASIVEAETRLPEERPLISAVFHNRLRNGMPLEADPTVQYLLPERKPRLLYQDIEATKGNLYNTYHHPGLPPGPINSPSEAALDAALHPAPLPYLYFVAKPDGSHVFSETLREHINAKNRIAREAAPQREPARQGSRP